MYNKCEICGAESIRVYRIKSRYHPQWRYLCPDCDRREDELHGRRSCTEGRE